MRRSIEADGNGSGPPAKRTKFDQNLQGCHPEQNAALIESLRNQSATNTHISRFPFLSSPTLGSVNRISETNFNLLHGISRQLVAGNSPSNFNRAQDDLFCSLLLEQHIRNMASGAVNLTLGAQANAPSSVQPSLSQYLSRLRSSGSFPNFSAVHGLHQVSHHDYGIFAPLMQGTSGRINSSVLKSQIELINQLQQPLNLRALQNDERIESQLLGAVKADISGPIAEAHKISPKGFLGYSHEGDRLIAFAMDSEHWVMSEYQCLLRQQIVFVESTASASNNNGKTQGRNKPIVQGQVGILCRHCANLPSEERARGAIYYPAKLHRIYQAAQNMAHNHFATSCHSIPEETRQKLLSLKEKKTVTIGAGKEYWYTAAVSIGIREGEDRLFFCKETAK